MSIVYFSASPYNAYLSNFSFNYLIKDKKTNFLVIVLKQLDPSIYTYIFMNGWEINLITLIFMVEGLPILKTLEKCWTAIKAWSLMFIYIGGIFFYLIFNKTIFFHSWWYKTDSIRSYSYFTTIWPSSPGSALVKSFLKISTANIKT
jgi:hypothetical protein